MNDPWDYVTMKESWHRFDKAKPTTEQPIRVNMKHMTRHNEPMNFDCTYEDGYITLKNGKQMGVEPWDEWRYI